MPAITIGKEKALDNEKSTIQKIANVLDDNWTLVVPARKVSLEGDLILISSDYLVLIEIKNSVVRYRKGGFEQQNRKSSSWKKIDPIGQMDGVFHDLMKYKKEMYESNRYVPTNYFLCTPESHDAGIPDEVSDNLSQIHLGNLDENLERFIVQNSKKIERPFTDREIQNMIKKITPDGDLISIVKSKEIGVQDRLVECTNEQKRVLDGFKSQKMFSILGGAGTGKTVLAMDAVRKRILADKSSKYIFACYTNRLYRDYLSRRLPKNVFGGTITMLLIQSAKKILGHVGIDYDEFKKCLENIKNRGMFGEYFEAYGKEFEAFVLSEMVNPTKLHSDMINFFEIEHDIEFSKMTKELLDILQIEANGDRVAEKIVKTINTEKISLDNKDLEGLKFDGLFCDEGQDISPPWFLFFANLVTPEQYELYIFYDLNQKVLGKSEFKMPLEMFEFDLNSTGNCRSTDQIAIFANLVLGQKDNLVLKKIHGDNVKIISNKNLEFLCKNIESEIKKLLQGGAKETDIAILYGSSTSDIAKSVNLYFEKKYLYIQKDQRDSTGNIDSIRRFKGLEKKYVFLVVESSDFDENKKLIYVGATRATTQLECMIHVNDDFNINELKESYGEELEHLISL